MNIHFGDCFELFKKIQDNTLDCCITDPPYFLDNLSNEWLDKDRKQNSHIAKLPCGMKFEKNQGIQFEEFMEKVSKEIYRILKPGAFYLAFSSPRMYHNLTKGIERAGFQIRDQLCWQYRISQVKAFRQDHIIDKDKEMNEEEKQKLKEKLKNYRTPQLKPQFEPICLAMKPIEGRFIDNIRKWGTGLMYVNPLKTFPTNILQVDKPSRNERKDNIHPTVKPLELIKRLIELFCPEKGQIIDPFLGSGTTAVAAKELKRTFIGSEKEKLYKEIILKRVNNVQN